MQNQIEERKKKNAGLVIMILTLMVSVIGATYAYFMITPAVNNSIRGTASTADMTLDISRISPTSDAWTASNKVMIPHLESGLSTAMGDGYYCVDEYGNIICQVYEMILTNVGTAQVVVDGTVSFIGTTGMPNLKWRVYGSDTQLTASTAATNLSGVTTNSITEETPSLFADDVTLKMVGVTGNTKYYYLVVWVNAVVNANGSEGVQTDSGTYVATVDFRSSNGTGVTSTFTS